jgi:hypothetical protein
MKKLLLSMVLAACAAAGHAAQTTTVIVVETTAQQDAETMARRGFLGHCGRNGGRREGVGFSAISADHAIRSCCFWGRYRVREIGVARGTRGWYACVRYE